MVIRFIVFFVVVTIGNRALASDENHTSLFYKNDHLVALASELEWLTSMGLHQAIDDDHPHLMEIIKRFVEKGGDPNILDNGGQAVIHKLVEKDYVVPVRIILDKGKADVNIADFNGDTPLHLAVGKESIDMIHVLMNRGANPDLPNKAGQTAFDKALLQEDIQSVQLIFDKLVRRNIRNALSDYGVGLPLEFFFWGENGK